MTDFEYVRALQRLFDENNSGARSFDSQIRAASTSSEALGSTLQAVAKAIHELSRTIRAASDEHTRLRPKLLAKISPMAQRSWFISGYLGMSELLELADLPDTLSDDDLDRHITDLYRGNMLEHTRALLADYPNRAFAIQPAVNAHLRAEYALSVPVFFAQVDGILYDRVARQIYSSAKNSVQGLASLKLEQVQTESALENSQIPFASLSEIMWSPLGALLPLAYGPSDRKTHGYSGLNRHTVLHGIASHEYATEENSLKAFSLLSHIGALMAHGVDDAKN